MQQMLVLVCRELAVGGKPQLDRRSARAKAGSEKSNLRALSDTGAAGSLSHSERRDPSPRSHPQACRLSSFILAATMSLPSPKTTSGNVILFGKSTVPPPLEPGQCTPPLTAV